VESQELVDSLENQLLINSEPTKRIDILLALGKELNTKNPDKALMYAEQALSLSKETNNTSELRSYNLLAEVLTEKTQFKLAMDYATKARLLAEIKDDKEQLAYAYYHTGMIYTNLGDYENGSEMYYNCLQLSEQIGNRVIEVNALNSIGVIYHNQNNFDKALEYYIRALNLARDINYKKGIARGLNNAAAMYGVRKEYRKFEEALREAISINYERKDMDIVGVNYLNLGYYFQVQHLYDSALFYFHEALNIYNKLNNTSSITSVKIFLTEFYYEINNLQKSKMYALEALEEGKSAGLKRLVYEAYTWLSKIYFAEGDSLAGYRYQVLDLYMKDSLNIEESQTQMTKLELQYELEKEEQKKQEAQRRKDLINVIVLISLIFIILVIVLLLNRMRMKAKSVLLEKDKLEMNLELRNKELTANVMTIMKKNETLTQIANRLKGIQKEAVKDETKSAIRKISNELKNAVSDEPWEEFELRFKQVHNDFFKTLLENYPNLSPQEQRLCALLRLNMTSKEISGITGQQVATIEMARTRLRKKLGITNTSTNLITFLAQLGNPK
jgi:tetratricopeptide (TPR) repeat protein